MTVTIREWKKEDAENLAKILNNKRIQNNMNDGLPYPYTQKHAESFINFTLSDDLEKERNYAIDVDGQAVGCIGVCRQERIHRFSGTLGYYLSENYWGQGIMTEAINLFCRKIFAETDLIRIEAEVFTHNTPSCRVLTKSGFQVEGIRRKCAVKNGQTLDIAVYALTRQTEVFPVRKLNADERQKALDLAWKVFCEYESPVYAPEGTEEFYKCIHDENYLNGIEYYGAFENEQMIGLLGVRVKQMHICFFFVEGAYHRKGIGTKLFSVLRKEYPDRTITLNSSPFGLPFYKKLGFVPTEEEKTVSGIRFTPMHY